MAYAYVANNGDGTVTQINLSTFLTVGSALAVGSDPPSIAIDPTGTYAYVANSSGSTVTKINLSTGSWLRRRKRCPSHRPPCSSR